MADIYLSCRPKRSDIAACLNDATYIGIYGSWEEACDSDTQPEHTVVLSTNTSEFPFGLEFQFKQFKHEDWLLRTARLLAIRLSCRTLYTGWPEDPVNPFYCLLFDCGLAYQADDEGTRLSGEGEKAVHIVRRAEAYDDPTVISPL